MLAVILKILSILGIILLILLGILLFVILLVLFLPIVYRIDAEKDTETLQINGRVRWLLGLVRVRILYPEPGNIVAKLLWFTLYDSKEAKKKGEAKTTGEATDAVLESASDTALEHTVSETDTIAQERNSNNFSETSKTEEVAEESPNLKEKLFAKYEKIKYTIRKIYDKIKHILANITFYKELLQDEDTKGLVSHACKRLGKILRSIRPRKLKADIVFGTGSPDTTGYAFGLYGMFSPKLGKQVLITPDFTKQILEGRIYAAGHITIFTLLFHLLAVLFDRRLQLLKQRLDAHKNKMKQKT